MLTSPVSAALSLSISDFVPMFRFHVTFLVPSRFFTVNRTFVAVSPLYGYLQRYLDSVISLTVRAPASFGTLLSMG
jgi:hypothetical protein